MKILKRLWYDISSFFEWVFKKLFGKKEKEIESHSRFADRKTKGEMAVHIVVSVILGVFALTYVISFMWGVMAGLKTHKEITLNPFGIPEVFQWRNYLDVFTMLEVRGINMLGMIGNSMLLVLAMPLLGVLGSGILAYIVAKYRFPGRNMLLSINIIVMTLPIIGTTASSYRLFSSLGMIDSPLLLINGIGCFGGTFLYMLSCFKGISDTYMEAAKIDGAGHYTIMFKVMAPMSMGTASALWILSLISVWNDVGTALLYWPNMPTLATGIYLFNLDMTYRVRMDILMAATIVSAIPPLLLFIFFHKKILTNVTFGGIKG